MRLLLFLILLYGNTPNYASETLDYTFYHNQVVLAETLIAHENYKGALKIYEKLFEEYEFVFLRDYKIAAQLALYLNDMPKTEALILDGIQSGWTMKSIKKNKFLEEIRKTSHWQQIKEQYKVLSKEHETSLDLSLRDKVKKMSSKDQWKALGALFRFSSNAQDRYAERKFAPHSEQQINELIEILSTVGYPGEKLVGNEVWMSTILSHHNSISQKYNAQDTLYQFIEPKLKEALKKGEISAFSYAIIDEWRRAVLHDDNLLTYGILDGPLKSNLAKTNQLRQSIYLRSVEVHNKLVDVEVKTGMNFYLDGHPWDKEKIEIR